MNINVGFIMISSKTIYELYQLLNQSEVQELKSSITETFGATVDWAEDTQTLTITKDETTIVMQIGSTTALVNGEEKTLDTAPSIIKNRTLVPVRFIAEALGLTIDYDEESKTVVVE